MAGTRRRHDTSLPPWTVRLPEDASASRVARAALDEWLRSAEPGVRRDARSVVSELVASAVGHGSPPIELSVEQRGGRVRIEVSDAGEPSGRRPPACWSQQIVNGLSARRGVRGDDAHLWFELPVTTPAPTPELPGHGTVRGDSSPP